MRIKVLIPFAALTAVGFTAALGWSDIAPIAGRVVPLFSAPAVLPPPSLTAADPAPLFFARDYSRNPQDLTAFLKNSVTSTGLPLSYRVSGQYWNQVEGASDSIDGVIERQIIANSVNIYDAAVWQIAMRKAGDARSARLAEDFMQRLIRGRSGDLRTIRAYENPYRYGDERKKMSPKEAFFFRIISDRYYQPDPKDGRAVLPGFPNDPRLHHEDWKPITGEQAWAAVIGPLQLEWSRYGGFVPLESDGMQLALGILPAIEAMRSPIGAIYHAPEGTHGKDANDISSENNSSMLAALRMVVQISRQNKDWESARRAARLAKGIERYFRDYAYDAAAGVFVQGGHWVSGDFRPSPIFAADCQTWGIITLGPAWVDANFGEGAAWRIWRNTRDRAGVFQNGVLQGIGFTDGNDVLSSEWTAGAVLCAKMLARHYASSHPEWSAEAAADARTMREGIEALRVRLEDGSSAYLYANRRFYIPFGWWANPIPSLAATAWVDLLDRNFNPFVLGGSSEPLDKSEGMQPTEHVFAETLLPLTLLSDAGSRIVFRARMPDNLLPEQVVIEDSEGNLVARQSIRWSRRGEVCLGRLLGSLVIQSAGMSPDRSVRMRVLGGIPASDTNGSSARIEVLREHTPIA